MYSMYIHDIQKNFFKFSHEFSSFGKPKKINYVGLLAFQNTTTKNNFLIPGLMIQ